MGTRPPGREGVRRLSVAETISDTEGGRGCDAVAVKILALPVLDAAASQSAFDSRQRKRDKAGCGPEDGCGFGRYDGDRPK